MLNFHQEFQKDFYLYPKLMAKGKPYQLKEGVVLKLGKQKLRLQKI